MKNFTKAMKEAGFVKRGSAYFRVIGDGVFQTVKYCYEAHMEYRPLYFGLQSLYSEMRKLWFTSFGCIPGYTVFLFDEMKNGIPIYREHPILLKRFSNGATKEEQNAIFLERVLPWLDSIQTQTALLEALMILDTAEYGEIFWGCGQKVFVNLACKNYDLAEYEINSILQQHISGEDLRQKRNLKEGKDWSVPWSEEQYAIFKKACENVVPRNWWIEEDLKWVFLHNLIKNGQEDVIQNLLQSNFRQSEKWARFCKSKRGKTESASGS